MQAFHFRLERVLKWKQQREQLAELRQQQARIILDAAQAQVESIEQQIQTTAARLEQQVIGHVALGAWMACYQHTAQLARALDQAEAKVRQAQLQLQQANQVRAKIATEVESLLVLKKQQWQEYRKRRQHHEEDQLDEIGLSRWLREQVDET